jgi:hypothetical protein
MGLLDTKNGVPASSAGGTGVAPPGRFGIDGAMQLMRSLPTDQNPELVATVIAGTLAALNVNVADIIEDANARAIELEARIATIKAANKEREKEIELGVDEIVRLEASLAEAMSVKERIQRAQDHRAAGNPPSNR